MSYPDKPLLTTIANSKLPQPPAGADVLYFPLGNPDLQPWPSKVLENNGRGQLHLLAWDLQGRATVRRCVWYMNDPQLAKQPVDRRSLAGAWDYLPVGPRPDMRALVLIADNATPASEPMTTDQMADLAQA